MKLNPGPPASLAIKEGFPEEGTPEGHFHRLSVPPGGEGGVAVRLARDSRVNPRTTLVPGAGPHGAEGPASSGFYTPPLWGVPERISEAQALLGTDRLSSPSPYFLLLA